MTRYDLLKMNVSVIKVFVDNKIDFHDVKNLDMFEEFCNMRNAGDKHAHVLSFLAEKYGVSERGVEKVVERMRKDVNTKS